MIVDIQCIDYDPASVRHLYDDNSFEHETPSGSHASVVVFGRSSKGSIAVRVAWKPWIRFRVPDSAKEMDIRSFVNKVSSFAPYDIRHLKSFYGYEASKTNPLHPKQSTYVDIRLPSFRSAGYLQKKQWEWECVDRATPWSTRFCNDFGLTESGWCSVPTVHERSWSTCTYEAEVTTLSPVARNDIAPLKIMSFDCEMYSNDGLFPQPHKGDITIMVCATVWSYGETSTKTVRLMKDGTDSMMEDFRDLIVDEDPDIITGWNIYGFDFQFMWNEYLRERRPHMRGAFTTRFANTPSTFVERSMSSAAKGDNTYRYWSMEGRVTVDLMQIIKDDKKPEDNTLKHVASLFLESGDGKLDMTPHDMFDAWARQDAARLEDVAVYCERDSEIPMRLIQKLIYIPTWVELSRVCYTSMTAILNGGQQRRVYNVIARFVHHRYAINPRPSGWPEHAEDYEGATVLEPEAGYYTSPVSVLDFESLYPSIMIYFNLCPSVLLLESATVPHDVHTIVHESGPRNYLFAKHTPGVLPDLLRHLLKTRKEVKQLMAKATGFEKFVLNGRQNALKVVCNSVYGFCGVSVDKGLLPCKPVAAVTTLKGRMFIDAAKTHVETTFPGSRVLYGDTDSIMVLWPPGLTVADAYAKGTLASQSVTTVLQSGSLLGLGTGTLDRTSVKLANEKVECPYLLIGKKMYAAVKWVPGSHGFQSELEFKGIDAVRRDRTKVVRDLSERILDALMIKADTSLAMTLLTDGLRGVLDNTISLDDYVMSKGLKGSYASENLPHVAAWRRMTLRGDSGIPPQGSRMPFIVTMPKGKKVPLYEIAEHPAYVKLRSLRPWPEYYIDQIRSAIERILQPTGIPVAELFASADVEAKFLRNGTASLKPKMSVSKRPLEPGPQQVTRPAKTATFASLKTF